LPSRVDTKAIQRPSGDQAGSRSSAGSSVSCTSPQSRSSLRAALQSARMAKMSALPVRSLTKVSQVHPGDQAGSSSLAALFVTRRSTAPG
jgi:hypothetical protein